MSKCGLHILWALCIVLSASVVGAEVDQESTAADSASASVKPELARPSDPGKPYTSIIIDAGGLNLQRSMSPKIRKIDGTEVWGTVKIDYDFLEEHGLVVYATSLEEAKRSNRCGENPMTIKALGIAESKFASDPVIAAEDAALLMEENSKGKFLDKFNVIFVKCPLPVSSASAQR